MPQAAKKKASTKKATATPKAATKAKATSKAKAKSPAKTTAKGPAKPAARSRSRRKTPPPPTHAPRTLTIVDDDDAILSTGAGGGIGFGRCGGRVLHSQLEQTLCDSLTARGIAHSHTPRHFEVRIADKGVAAYPPMIVLRGRGREGKTVVLEGAEHADKPLFQKISAFREQYGSEFYVTFIADEELLDEVPLAAYDESCTLRDLNNLINRLAE